MNKQVLERLNRKCLCTCVCDYTLNSHKYYVGTNTERIGEEEREEAKQVAIHLYYESTGVQSF